MYNGFVSVFCEVYMYTASGIESGEMNSAIMEYGTQNFYRSTGSGTLIMQHVASFLWQENTITFQCGPGGGFFYNPPVSFFSFRWGVNHLSWGSNPPTPWQIQHCSRSFRSRLMGQHLSDASRDLATLTFDLGDHSACRWCESSFSVCVPKIWAFTVWALIRLVTLTFDLLTSK